MSSAAGKTLVEGIWSAGWTPDPELSVADWAAQNRVLGSESSSEPGPWSNERTPFLREPMHELSPMSPTKRVVLMKSAQIGGTECGNNWVGYIIDQAPGPMLMVQPNLGMVKKVVRQRLDPMFASTAVLANRITVGKSRSASNSLAMKQFPGGVLLFAGANSAASLRSMPIRYLFFDELDAADADLDGEGDPLSLAERRTTTFPRRKIFLPSTPLLKATSRIYREWLRSDQRRFFVPCPHCGRLQYLRWRDEDDQYRLICDRDAHGKLKPETAKYLCENCAVLIEEKFKTEMLLAGKWHATAPGDGETAGFHISALYSPLGWFSWRNIMEEFLRTKEFPERLQVFVNTILGEPYEDERSAVGPDKLRARVDKWERGFCPDGVAVIIVTVDVQDDRLECQTMGFGAGEENWILDYEIIWGDTSADETVWTRLSAWRERGYTNATGRRILPSITLIDRGGHSTSAVDSYCAAYQGKRVFGIVGKDYISRPGLAMQSEARQGRLQIYLIATFAAKDRIYARLKKETPGPGYTHFPSWLPDQYFDQLTAEKKLPMRNKRTGRVKVVYIAVGRNEALDLTVYGHAALFILRLLDPARYTDLERLRGIIHVEPVVGAGEDIPRRRVRHRGLPRR